MSYRTPRLRPRTSAAIAALAVAALLSACTAPDSEPNTGDETQAVLPAESGSQAEIDLLNWAVGGDIRSTDPAHAFDTTAWVLLQTVVEPLVQIDANGQIVGVLAESWEQLDATTFDFVLRDGVTFSDGTPLATEDVIYSINRYTSPDIAAEQGTYFGNLESVTATDDGVEIKLKNPQPEFLSYLAYGMIVEKAAAEAAGADFGNAEGLVIGTGAFVIESYSPSVGATVVRNDNYWGDAPRVKKVVIKVIKDAQSMLLAMQAGEIDGAFDVSKETSADWEALDNARLRWVLGPAPMFLILDTTQAPFDDIHARKALAYLIDRAGIAQSAFAGHAAPAQTLAAPALWSSLGLTDDEITEYYASLPDYSFDIDKAREELSQSATPEGFAVTVKTVGGAESLALQAIKESAAEIGIDIDVQVVPDGEYVDGLLTEDHVPVGEAIYSVLAATPLSVPGAVLGTNQAPSPFSTYTSPELLENFDTYFEATDENERAEAAKAIITELSDQVPFVPVVFGDNNVALSDKFVLTEDYSVWNLVGGIDWAAAVALAAE